MLSLDVGPGRVRSSVQGSRATPYATGLRFHTWDAETQRDLADAVAGSPSVLAAVLGGRMPEDFEQLTLGAGLALFPESLADARFDCTCPDWGDPCKHAAAVVYLLAEWLDTEPFGVLTLRGVERDALLAQVAALQRSSPADVEPVVEEAPLADVLGPFYGRAAPLPAMGASAVTGPAVLDGLDAGLLGPGGARAVARLRRSYEAMTASRTPPAHSGSS